MFKSFYFRSFSMVVLMAALSGCSTMTDKLADLQLQKKQLANGKTVYVDTNVLPTANWGCTMVDAPQYYNWAQIRLQGQFQWGGPYGILTQKALDYANQQNLQINYINLGIPTENTFSTGSGRFTDHHNLNPNAMAVTAFYNCRQINPEHRLGAEQKNDMSVRFGN